MALLVKNPPDNAGDVRDMGLIPGLERSSGGGYGNPFQYSCLEDPGKQQFTGSQRVGHHWSNLACTHTQTHTRRPWSSRLLCLWDSPGKNTEVGCPHPRDLPDPRIELVSPTAPALQVDSLSLSPGGVRIHRYLQLRCRHHGESFFLTLVEES